MKAQIQYILGDEDTMLLKGLLQAMHRLRNFYEPAGEAMGKDYEAAQAAWNTVTQQKVFTMKQWGLARNYILARAEAVRVRLELPGAAMAEPVRIELKAALSELIRVADEFYDAIFRARDEWVQELQG